MYNQVVVNSSLKTQCQIIKSRLKIIFNKTCSLIPSPITLREDYLSNMRINISLTEGVFALLTWLTVAADNIHLESDSSQYRTAEKQDGPKL
ncbi:hypothetical protein T12_15616 [Trichinella patagoniensis]|uniref:Uncharacterized protein n=1 Tax=Trichinella patagoniensis TaxID=990121 RepID=A0A0V1A006_9BILA|nr:hypothetical protein T12_15616 [Trichinella patagoniensis]